ncbi:uncharacterized protein BP01DRAFT_313672 [Aspergillus saccharolyticus JOP 1030-1]|uniref:RNA polymerase I-specific transcription initiation factor RRN6-like protein n=1 Tax=Aspergillus saccharolyticus JOP 1030-1 TaxID=1450539 RepID=A0A318ZLC9_9EURO|nr:hypothetical protein BP01DRAFT_313672 [Aspergillus saccharolyticus JOP 1030-1]PYH47687.1 hypothetical protein BP01DRAFT_313672 [Aspergillus saccharolyticus JOP 1030-1]
MLPGARTDQMDEQLLGALQYGHLGRPKYISETQTWLFPRTLAPTFPIAYAGVNKHAVKSPLTAPQSSLIENKGLLPHVFPELAACWPLASEENASHVITTSSELCDPSVSSLLDFGYAVDLENSESGARGVPIAIIASGECGNVVSFRKLEENTIELKCETTQKARVSSIGNTERTDWSVRGAAVRQICFARPVEEQATWMAARLPQFTTIFRPQYHRNPIPSPVARMRDHKLSFECCMSRLDANPVVEISISQTGGYAHADVTFNPWYQKQIGIVDVRGGWSIWDLSGRHSKNRSSWMAACVKTGSLPWLDFDDSQDSDDRPHHDGWAAIEWVRDVNSFIVCDRRCLMLYRTQNGQVCPYPIELGLKRKSEWILDIKRSASNVSHVFILTTSRIFWLAVASASDLATGDSRPAVFPQLSWRHFRDSGDTTMRLHSFLIHEDLHLMLYSRLNPFTLVFPCSYVHDTEAETITLHDPFILDIPPSDIPSDHQLSPNGTQFSTLIFRATGRLPLPISNESSVRASILKLFALDSHLSVQESVYIGFARDSAADGDPLPLGVLKAKRRAPGTQSVAFGDDFVTHDWDESTSRSGVLTSDAAMSNITPLTIPQWTLDYTRVYAVATSRLGLSSSRGGAGKHVSNSLDKVIQQLEVLLADAEASGQFRNQTGLEILGEHSVLNDIDRNAHEWTAFWSRTVKSRPGLLNLVYFANQVSYIFTSITLADVNRPLSPTTLYEELVGEWLGYLPPNTPGRTRFMKEQIIRSVVADLILAQFSIRCAVPGHGFRDFEQVGSQVSSLPARSSNENEESLSAAISEHSDESAFPSSMASRLACELDESEQEDLSLASTGLSAITTFKSEQAMNPGISDILQHWQPGANPAEYSWQRNVAGTQATIATTPKRRRSRRTVSLHGSQQDGSIALPTPVVATDTTRTWGSQPENLQPPSLRLHSSQMVDESVSMTQIERGMFGGRETGQKNSVKARKKKRAAGF